MLYHLSYSRMPSADSRGNRQPGFARCLAHTKETGNPAGGTRGNYLGGMIWK